MNIFLTKILATPLMCPSVLLHAPFPSTKFLVTALF